MAIIRKTEFKPAVTAEMPDDWGDDRKRCYSLLCELFRGAHHIDGTVGLFGNGIRMTTHQSFATFDFDLLTRFVLLCHKYRCRGEILPNGGPGRIALSVHPRAEKGCLWERHPGLFDLRERI